MWDDFLYHLFSFSNSFKDHRNYSIKHPRRRKSGWFLKVIIVVGGSYLIYLYLKAENLI